MVQSVPPTPSGAPSRPQGVGLTALALCALLAIGILPGLLRLAGQPFTSAPVIQPLLLCLAGALACFILWHYWKGRDWARVAILLWSILAAAQAISILVEHNLDPAALMSRPLSFFQTLLAVFLLYWLNTSPLRAWFKKMSGSTATLLAGRLDDRLCTALDFYPAAAMHASPAVVRNDEASPSAAFYRLSFEHGAQLTLHCPWRIVLDDNLAFASAPAAGSAALSGSPEQTHAPAVPDPSRDPDDARRLLQNLRVTAVRIAPHSSDLFLTFEMGIELQTWTPAAEAGSANLWQFSDPVLTVIAGADGLGPQLVDSSAPAASQPANG